MPDTSPVKFFSKLIYFFFGYFDPIYIFFIIKINNFRGVLNDISAKTASLHITRALFFDCHLHFADTAAMQSTPVVLFFADKGRPR